MSTKVNLKKYFLKVYSSLPKSFQKQPLFVAVSSGLDSSVLAHLLLSLRKTLPPIHWLHVNYHLRTPDSNQEEAFLKKWAQQEGVPIDVKSLKARTPKSNLQNWAREQRYLFFAKAIQEQSQSGGVLLTAHHERDQVETILSRLIMGSGLKSLKGMTLWEQTKRWDQTSKQTLKIFRPFLEVPREALEIYAQAHRVKFCEDKSNQSDQYLRNRLRQELLPKILKENPQAAQALTQVGRRAAAAHETIEPLAKRWLKKHQHISKNGKTGCLPRPALDKLPFGKRQIVLELFLKQFLTQTRNLGKTLRAMETSLDQKLSRHVLPLPHRLEWVLTSTQFIVRQKRK